MKHLIIIMALLCSTSALAEKGQMPREIKCNHEGVTSTIILADGVLMDDMERVIASEVSTGYFVSHDYFGKVTYTIHGNHIIMKTKYATKEYTCDL